MDDDKKNRLKEIRTKLANLTPEEKQALTNRGLIATVDGRVLSLRNTLMVYLQCNGNTPSVVGGFKQWIKAGRCVSKGQHGYTILFPVGNKDDEGNVLECETFYTGTVFDVSQTIEIETG